MVKQGERDRGKEGPWSFVDTMRELDRGRVRSLYFLYGNDDLISRAVRKLEQAVFAGPDTGLVSMNYVKLDGASTEPHEVISRCSLAPFGTERRLVIVEDAPYFSPARITKKVKFGEGWEEALLDYFQNPVVSTCLAVLTPGKSDEVVDRRRKLFKALQRFGVAVDCRSIPQDQLTEWVRKEAIGRSKEISRPVALKLIEVVGDNLNQLSSELTKLAAYAGDDETITVEMVERVAVPSPQFSIFNLLDAVFENRPDEAFRVLKRMLDTGEEPLMIMHMLIRQIRLIYWVKVLTEEGIGSREMPAVLKVHPFVVKKCLGQGRTVDTRVLREKMEDLLEIEAKVKSGGIRSPQLGIEMFISHWLNAS